MTAINWHTKPKSERSLQLRKSLDALSVSTHRKRNIASIARAACDGCPFRNSGCVINTSGNNPYGHLAVILTGGSIPRFPDAASNKRNLRQNLDDSSINVDEIPCADLLQSPKVVRDKYSRTDGTMKDTLDVDEPSLTKTWEVMIDFPVSVSFDHRPTEQEIDAAINHYHESIR